MTKPYQICSKCVMDTSDPDIIFDEYGISNHWHKSLSRIQKEMHTGEDAKILVNSICSQIKKSKSRDSPYDCVIGISGGVDSTYLAYYAKKVLGLNPLAVHFDNGWNSQTAVSNIKQVLSKLDIDLFTYVVDWQEFSDLQLSFMKASVINWEIPTDHAITALLYRIANKNNIQFILGGGNVATESIMPISWAFYARDIKHIRAIHKRFGTTSLNSMPSMSIKRFLYYTFIKKIRWISLLNCIDYNKKNVIDLLTGELGWKDYGGKHYESIFTRYYQGHVLPFKYGVDKRRAHLSSLIASGQITRDAALKTLQSSDYHPSLQKQDEKFLCKKFKISELQLADIIKNPPRSHYDFPSDASYFAKYARFIQLVKSFATRI